MKKQLKWMFIAILLCGANLSAQAQYYETKNEIDVSVGSAANSEIIGVFADFTSILAEVIITPVLTMGNYVGYVSYSDKSYTPAIAVGYYRHLNDLIAVGGYAAYNGLKRDAYATLQGANGTETKELIGDAKRSNFSLMPSVKFHWVRTKNFGFYSKAGVGVTFSNEKQNADKVEGGTSFSDTDVYFNFDVTPIGLDAGSPTFRGFLEFGMGEQGLLRIGARYKF